MWAVLKCRGTVAFEREREREREVEKLCDIRSSAHSYAIYAMFVIIFKSLNQSVRAARVIKFTCDVILFDTIIIGS